MTDTAARKIDIVLFGATGFVGKLVAAQLAHASNDHLTIALAGRSQTKLDDVVAATPRTPGWRTIVADASDYDAMRSLAEQTKVVITTVGPYASYGKPLVSACAQAGTHYVDLTGEVLFHRDVIDGCDAAARTSGARIVNSCGYDSVPSDIAVFEAARTAREQGAGELLETTNYATMKGGLSGGTVASAITQADVVNADPARRKVAGDKFALSPNRSQEPDGEFRDSLDVWYSDDVDAWVAPFMMASYNTRLVRRSNALLGHSYGPGFRYREVVRIGKGKSARLRANLMRASLVAGFAALGFKPARGLVERIVPSPGTGPSQEQRESGYFRMDVRARTTSGAVVRSVVSAQADPGYDATSIMLAQAGLTLAQDDLPGLPDAACGGVVTPVVGLGQPYIERLRRAGFTIETSVN